MQTVTQLRRNIEIKIMKIMPKILSFFVPLKLETTLIFVALQIFMFF